MFTSSLRVTGNHPKKEGDRLIYAAEYSHQGEGDDNTVNYDEHYQLIEVGGEFKTVQLTLGHEVLGGDADGTTATEFQTPLATLHKFNGWADEFLTTPDGGLKQPLILNSGDMNKKDEQCATFLCAFMIPKYKPLG